MLKYLNPKKALEHLPKLIIGFFLFGFGVGLLVGCNGGGGDGVRVVGGGGSGPYLAWDRNTEPDLTGYKIYWGDSSGNYSRSQVVNDPNETVWYLDQLNLFPGTNYINLTAYDTSGNESDYSKEVSYNK